MSIRKKHSLVNIICIGVFSIVTLKNLVAFDSSQVLVLAYSMLLYFLVDIAWLWKWPESNPSPSSVIFHHILSSILLLLGPIPDPTLRPILIKTLVIEPTTWLAHFRRFIRPRRYYLLDVATYMSMFGVRHLWSPYVLYELLPRAHESLNMTLTTGGAVFMNCMYVFWTVRYTARAWKADPLVSEKQEQTMYI